MKTFIATAIALTVAAPAFADASSTAAAIFAQGNDSARETVLNTDRNDVSEAAILKAQEKFAMGNDSARQTVLNTDRNVVSQDAILNARKFFAMGNDSAAEIHVN